jgi:Ca2+-binding RTX toxin-like protein
MTGGTGNDIYRIDNTRDKVTESASAGIDRVESTITWTLGSNFENLTLTGTAAINGTGNTLDNVLTGNAAANVLSGSSGNDTLDGGAGNDTLAGGSGADTYRFAAGKGVDTVQENDGTSGVSDRVDFGSLLQSQVAFQRSGNNLEALIVGSNVDKLVVKDWYLGTQYRVEQFAFADGATLSDAQVQGLVDAMAGFAPGTASVEPVLRLDTSYSMSRDMGSIAAQVA